MYVRIWQSWAKQGKKQIHPDVILLAIQVD
jgi:hypothetical protein